MPNYDFHNSLSPYEFEQLARDILEIKEKVPFESSVRGRDGGVDLRYWNETTKVIVQIKCYQDNFRQLFSVLKNQEKSKAVALNPDRYILVTALELTISQRDEIFVLFEGLIQTRDDIIDRTDLNKLLGQEEYHQVERNHYKLWLSSSNVLASLIEEIVHRANFTESMFELEEIKDTVKLFVQNPAFEQALGILEKNRFVLISGEPGIGKTTLGRCLAAYFLQRGEYKDFIYSNSVESALSRYKDSEKQIFFFDDFWGSIFKGEKMPFKEEIRLINLIKRISKSNNKILILTTREYVLQQGLAEYQNSELEHLFETSKCILQLEVYSDLIKARILFNHLYFSNLEWEKVKSIADNYEEIIHHKHYNPRIIEAFLNQSTLYEDCEPIEYYRKLRQYLDEPLAFWEDIFWKQTYGAQITLLILLLSSQPMQLRDLKASFCSCIAAGREDNIQVQEREFDNIIIQLEKTMIKTYQDKIVYFCSETVVKFQNPSIKDFLYHHLANNLAQYGKMLIKGCPFINQLLLMFTTKISRIEINEDFIVNEDAFLYKGKIKLPKNLENVLVDQIISRFDELKYSYVERNVFEHRAYIHDSPEECIVNKMLDILWSLDVTDSFQLLEFLKAKSQYICETLHGEEYPPLSYNDMVLLPYLVDNLNAHGIKFEERSLLDDYYKHCKFAEHYLAFHQFKETFPKEYSNFMKTNYKTIKEIIREVLLDDIEYFSLNDMYDYVDLLLDIIYPQILEKYKIRHSKKYFSELLMVAEYDDVQSFKIKAEHFEPTDANGEDNVELVHERIVSERDALLGISEDLDEDIIRSLIKENVKDENQAAVLISITESKKPWYVWPFLEDCNGLSILISFYQEEKRLPLTCAQFYEKLGAFLVKQSNCYLDGVKVDVLVDMFSEFAFDMVNRGKIFFTKNDLENHPAFKRVTEIEYVDFSTILSVPFLVKRRKWYEFQTVLFEAYFALKRFMRYSDEERLEKYKNFLNLDDYFVDMEHEIWALCSELDLQVFNKAFLIPTLKEYLLEIDSTSRYSICRTTFGFFKPEWSFEIEKDTLLPLCCRSSWNCSKHLSAQEFVGKYLVDIEEQMSYREEDESDEAHLNLQRLSRFIKDSSLPHAADVYVLDLAKYIGNSEFYEILESLGVITHICSLYVEIKELVDKAIAANYDLRLDSFTYNRPATRFAIKN